MDNDFEAALVELDMRKVDLAKELGINPATISRWGDRPPKYVRAYLVSRLENHKLRDENYLRMRRLIECIENEFEESI